MKKARVPKTYGTAAGLMNYAAGPIIIVDDRNDLFILYERNMFGKEE